MIYSDILDFFFFNIELLLTPAPLLPLQPWIDSAKRSLQPWRDPKPRVTMGRDDHFGGEDAAGVVVLPVIASAAALLDMKHGGEVAAF